MDTSKKRKIFKKIYNEEDETQSRDRNLFAHLVSRAQQDRHQTRDRAESIHKKAEVMKAEDVEINHVPFRQLSSTCATDENSDIHLSGKQIHQDGENNRNSAFRRLLSNYEQDQEYNQNEKREIEEKSNEIVETAKKQANEIKEEAREKGYKEGYKEGYDEGVETGKNEAIESVNKETEPLIELLSDSIKEISTLNDTILENVESNTLKLSMIIAKKLACRELSMHPDAIVDIVKSALKLVEDGKQMVIKVNPLDLEIVKKYRPDILQMIQASSSDEFSDVSPALNIDIDLVIKKDEAISRGGCVIETETQSLDATFETRFYEIVDAILSEQE